VPPALTRVTLTVWPFSTPLVLPDRVTLLSSASSMTSSPATTAMLIVGAVVSIVLTGRVAGVAALPAASETLAVTV
jgi:hypothetical protein